MKKKVINLIKKIFSTRKRAVITVVVLVIGGYLLWGKVSGNGSEPVIQTSTVQRGTIVSSVTASGNVVSSNIENVTTQASGTVKKVYVSDGDEVYIGQKLAEIDLDVQGAQNHASAYSTYISAVNSLNSAKNNYRLTQASLAVVYDEIQGHDDDETFEMKETRTRAEVSNDNAYDAIISAQARLSSAALAYKTTSPVITSPVSGIVKSVTIAEGMNIGATETASGSRANQRIATIGTEGLPIATFNVSEIDVSLIKPEQKATITLDSIIDKTFTGSVVSVDRVGSITNNVTTYPVIIQLDTKSEQILPNMAASASIITDTKSDILIVPSTAISYLDGQTSVTVLRGDQKINQLVEVGISNDTETEITSGLSEENIVVTSTTTTSSNEQQPQGPGGGGFFPIGGGSRGFR
jgi:RND family efflux transporter MFP subunit